MVPIYLSLRYDPTMSSKIKGSIPSVESSIASQIQQSSVQAGKTKSSSAPSDSFSKSATSVPYKSSSLIPSAKIFAGEVNFPPHLLDSRLPTNDRKFRRLLGAILGFGELEDCFRALEEELDKEEFPFKSISSEDERDPSDSEEDK